MLCTHNELAHHHKIQLLIRFARFEGWQVKWDGRYLEMTKPGLPPIYTTNHRPLFLPSAASIRHAGDSAHD